MYTNNIPVNSIINDTYRVICPIGNGGTGIIYLAEHLHLRKKVVLKKIKNNLKSSSAVRQEADILKYLHHMYLPQVYDFIELGGSVFTVIDYIEGSDLDKYLSTGTPVSEERLIKWMIQMCDALSYLHSRKPMILHNDIKPANIIINKNDDISLIDFNISTDTQDVVLGFTASYASPEQYYNVLSLTDRNYSGYACSIDARSDLYSLGASFYAMASRVQPSVYEAINGSQPQLSPESCGMSEGFCRIINRLMSVSPDDRYSTASETKKALQKLYKQDSRYRKYVLMQAGALLFSGMLIISGVWMIFRGVRLEHMREFSRSFTSLSENYDAHNYDGAVTIAVELLNDDSYSNIIDSSRRGRIYYILAMSYYGREQYQAAAQQIENALACEKDPSARGAYELDGAVIYAFLGSYDRAQELLDDAYSNGISYNDYVLTLAQIKYVHGDYAEVIDSLNSIETPASDTEAAEKKYELLGDSYYNTGDTAKAIEAFSTSYSASGNISAARKIASLYYEQGRNSQRPQEVTELLKTSASWYETVISSELRTVQDFVNISKVYRALVSPSSDTGYYSDALKALKTAEKSYQDNYLVYQQMAITYYAMGSDNEAKHYCDQCFKLYDKLTPNEKVAGQDDDMMFLREISGQLK